MINCSCMCIKGLYKRKIETFIQYLKGFHFVKPKDTNIQKLGFKNS